MATHPSLRSVTPPAGFRGEIQGGDEAARRASLVSGPFDAQPILFATPLDVDDLITLIRWAAESGTPVVPRGGGTGMPGGNLGPGVVVDLAPGFDGVGAVDPDTRTVRAGAGAVADRIQDAARPHGLRLPALPASSPWCRIGGVVANNGAGARSFRHGSIRPRVVALEGVDARGETFRLGPEAASDPWGPFDPGIGAEAGTGTGTGGRIPGWPRVRKNASGYALDAYLPRRDLRQLLIGSEGTLALITEVELSLEPVPETRGLTLVAAGDAPELAAFCETARQIGASACEFLGRRLLSMCQLDRDPELGLLARGAWALVLIELEGTEDEVEAGLRALGRDLGGSPRWSVTTRDPEAMDRLWGLRHRASPIIAREAGEGRISTQFIEDSVVPPDAVGLYIEGVEEILQARGFDAVVFGHAGDGNVHVNPLVDVESPDWRDRVRATLHDTAGLVRDLGGTLSGEHGDGRIRAPFLQKIWDEAHLEAFRRVKDHFDPQGILNPGVVLPLPGQDPLEGLRPRPRAFP
jgi:FAD/FMN-containing dehydrogenase